MPLFEYYYYKMRIVLIQVIDLSNDRMINEHRASL